MRESSTGRRFEGGTVVVRCAARAARLALLLACGLLLTACPPEGGDLAPLAQGEGAELVTTRFKDDTLRVTRDGVTVKARGTWSVADSRTSVILDIGNANAWAVKVALSRCELVNNDSGEHIPLRSVSDENAASRPSFLSDKDVLIDGQQERRFALEFKINSADGSSGVPKYIQGQTATLRIPAEMKSGAPAQFDFVFAFKFAPHRPAS